MTDAEIRDAATEAAEGLLAHGLAAEACLALDAAERTCLLGLHELLARNLGLGPFSASPGLADRIRDLRDATAPGSPVHERRARERIEARRKFEAMLAREMERWREDEG